MAFLLGERSRYLLDGQVQHLNRDAQVTARGRPGSTSTTSGVSAVTLLQSLGRLFVRAGDERLQFAALDAPHAAPAEFDRP